MHYCDRVTAYAKILGGNLAPSIYGNIFFDDVPGGTEVYVEVWGLPEYKPASNGKDPVGPFGFHIHELGKCEIRDPNNPFASAGNTITLPINLMEIMLEIFLSSSQTMDMQGCASSQISLSRRI